MGKVKPFRLPAGTRVGNYKIIGTLGRGWEGEVYAVVEVPTEAKRAMKLIRRQVKSSSRVVTHTAWFFEQVARSGSVARYYHMGQWFLDDDEGLFYLVFERLAGTVLKDFVADAKEDGAFDERQALRLVRRVAEAIVRVHDLKFAVGDFESGENIIVTGHADDPRPIFCDLDSGEPDKPNKNFGNDAKELLTLAKLILDSLRPSATTKSAIDLIHEGAKAAGSPATFRSMTTGMAAW